MKILFIVEHFPPHIGGVEVVFEEYAKRLSQKGYEVKVVTSNSGGIAGKKNSNGFETNYIICRSFFGHPIIPAKEMEIYAAWADIIHTTTYTAALSTIKIAKKFKKPCIITVHETLGSKWFKVEKNPLKALGFLFFEWLVIKKNYSFWHAVSEATKKDLLKYRIPEEKIKTIYHGIDYSVWNSEVQEKKLNKLFNPDYNEDKKIFLYNGRPGQTKGIFVLLEAIRKIRDKISNDFVFGFIISKYPEKERERFEKSVKKYGLENIVKITNSLHFEELPGYRKNCFTLIVPSLTEGFGFVAAETCTLGVPIISSNAGSLPEVVSGKALFFKSGDKNDLAEKIMLATENKFENIPEKVFDWEKSISEIEKMYKEIL